ncbi:barstar family protein [Streptomyces sp. B6B3]|uniref:barstar family protein n=1 Tax=Streptomyces sp. B6B3 TaxID=3153570 RepID=UPI00325D8B13
MRGTSWWDPRSPRLHVLDAAAAAASAGDSLPPTGMSYVARLDGAAMVDPDGVFTQFWERFRLPSYFGWNWDALHDCLRDLHWLPADRYLLVVSNAERVLPELPGERHILFRALARAAESWATSPGGHPGEGIPFNSVLLCDAAHTARLREEVSALGPS